ncbi:MAG: TonB-dependent receptor, partial [Candidatus Eremiobacteraeota bacterium]|nr:TonB-dependent receptor [Candidatus Eremiobacteraeota bacterium]
LIGYVLTKSGAPLQDAMVSATSASQAATTTTDQQGHFVFVALLPDSYVITVSKPGYRTVSQPGVEVSADNTQTVELIADREAPTLSKIVISEAAGLLKPGTTQDVYTVNAGLQSKLSVLGGGGNLDNAYSAISAIPGAFVPPGQTGWNQPIFLRGGDFNEIGYELDGIPLNRSFDNIPTTNLATLGQQQLQVYTGGAPADAEAHGLAGYVNQVIKTGTVPGFAAASLGFGSPALYNKFNFEAGGATSDRRLTYYFGVGGYNQNYRYIDQFNGASDSPTFGMPFDLANAAFGPLAGGMPGCPGDPFIAPGSGSNFAGCYANHAFFNALPAGPGGYILGPYPLGKNSNIADRENVVNFHYSIPHIRSGANDDIQLLYDTSEIFTNVYSSYFDWGGPGLWNTAELQGPGLHFGPGGPVVPRFQTGFQYVGALGQPVTGAVFGPIDNMIPYLFPSENAAGINGQVPVLQRDAQSNGQAIIKLQYQHDFGSAQFVRVYAYSDYSNWFVHSPNMNQQFFVSQSPDRELWTHGHGFAGNYGAQLNPRHLLNITASYTTSSTTSFDNGQMTNTNPGPPFFPPAQSVFAALVSSSSPLNGTCYFFDETNPASVPAPTSCQPGSPVPPFPFTNTKFLTFSGPFVPPPAGFEWLAVESGPTGVQNAVSPKFAAFSIHDEWRPVDRVHVNYGLRVDRFQFDLPSTAAGPMRDFWFNAWNSVMCANPGVNGGNPIDETLVINPSTGTPYSPGTPCAQVALPGLPAGALSNATLTNATAKASSFVHTVFQPRLGGTYEADPDDVVRFSYGAYAQPPPSQYIEYNTLQQNLASYIGPLYFALGYTTPAHDLRPSVSYNVDFSWEHRFHRTDSSFKLSPFYRRTRDKVQQFFINPTTGTLSGINAGRQTTYGAEFLLTKGDFAKDGLSAQFSFTYTYSRIRYQNLPNGSTLLTPVNSSIQLYNSYTSQCAGVAPSSDPNSLCGAFGGANAIATEPSGIANPYFNAPARPLLDPGGLYPTYDVVPTGTQLTTASYGVPYFATLVLNYKQKRWTFSPLLQFIAGPSYGAPQQQLGIDPAVGPGGLSCAPLAGATIANDPRYPYGGTGQPYDASTCPNTIVIPDQFTGNFDRPGAFREPSLFTTHAQVSYEASSRATIRLTLSNLYTRCAGGDSLPWTQNSGHTCGYDVIPGHIPPVGNIYNPGNTIQRLVKFPYGNLFSTQPFNAFFNLDFKL